MNLILIGPQGSGKGTQAKLLSQFLKIPALSMGQLYRREILHQTAIGKIAAPYVAAGKLVPDEITGKLLKKELRSKRYKKGVIFDGFPRTYKQNMFLEDLLKIDSVILIDIRRKAILKRLSGRYICDCGQTYNLYSQESEKPKYYMICDKCGHKLKQRQDDTPKAIRQRLKIYRENTKPLFAYYKKQKKLITISGEQRIEKIFRAILLALKYKGTIS
ncbi:MAG: nucleoside monophosphate kinase [Candidatus Parcubacteria bacterium]|nr:nucleoside monophosphate kinase [Candidatus Parcubacteria bacterium]